MGAYGGPDALLPPLPPGSITITYPWEGAVLPGFYFTISWETENIYPDENLRLVISHRDVLSSPYSQIVTPSGPDSLGGRQTKSSSSELDLSPGKNDPISGDGYSVQFGKTIIDLDVIVPNTGTHTVLLDYNTTYKLELSKEDNPDIKDEVNFSIGPQ